MKRKLMLAGILSIALIATGCAGGRPDAPTDENTEKNRSVKNTSRGRNTAENNDKRRVL